MAVTATQLRQVVEVPLDKGDLDLAPFLSTAALIRSENLTGSGLSLDRLDMIELYLAAHFFIVSIEHGGVVMSRKGQSADQYRQIDSKLTDFKSTAIGQMALTLDTSGILQSMGVQAKKAIFSVVSTLQSYNRGGPNNCSDILYEDI